MTDVSDDDKNSSNLPPSSNKSSNYDKPSLSTSGSGRSQDAGNAMEIDEVREDQPKKYNNYVLCRINLKFRTNDASSKYRSLAGGGWVMK